jgi:hypothetical protein
MAFTECLDCRVRGSAFTLTCEGRYVEQRVGDASHCRCDDNGA